MLWLLKTICIQPLNALFFFHFCVCSLFALIWSVRSFFSGVWYIGHRALTFRAYRCRTTINYNKRTNERTKRKKGNNEQNENHAGKGKGENRFLNGCLHKRFCVKRLTSWSMCSTYKIVEDKLQRTTKPGSHVSISIRTKQEAKQRNEVKPAI